MECSRGAHHRSAGLLGVTAQPGQQFVVSKPLADRVRDVSRVRAEGPETSLQNERHVSLLRCKICGTSKKVAGRAGMGFIRGGALAVPG